MGRGEKSLLHEPGSELRLKRSRITEPLVEGINYRATRRDELSSHSVWFIVTVLVRWATGKRLSNRLPKLSLTTISHHGTDRIYGSTCHQHVIPIYGDPEVFLSFFFSSLPSLFRFRFWTSFVFILSFSCGYYACLLGFSFCCDSFSM